MIYTPSGYLILKINTGSETIYKVMGSWEGRGMLDSDSWRMNSGITNIELDETTGLLSIHGNSGSIYKVPINAQGLNGYAKGILAPLLKGPNPKAVQVDIKEAMEIFKCK